MGGVFFAPGVTGAFVVGFTSKNTPPFSRSRALPENRGSTTLGYISAVLFWDAVDALEQPGFINFLKEHDFGGGFHRAKVEPADGFLNASNDVSRELVDQPMELMRLRLVCSLKEFLGRLYILATFSDVFARITTEDRFVDRGIERGAAGDMFRKNQKELNDLADAVVEAFNEFVRAGKQRYRRPVD